MTPRPQPHRPLNVVQVLAGPYPTRQGSQVYVRGMARALARRGHRVTVACYSHGDGTEERQDDLGVRIVRTPPVPGYDNLRAGPDLVKPFLDALLAARVAMLGRRADILHAHNYEAPLAAYLARSLARTPVVYNAHNTMEEELPVYFGNPYLQRVARRFGRLLDTNVPCRADGAIGISRGGVEALRSLGCRRLWHVPPGIELDDLAGARPGLARAELSLGERPWIIYAGNPDPYQDLDVLLDAVALLPEAGLIMVSASPLDQWERSCDRLGVARARRRFVVTSRWERVRDLLAAASVAALPRTVCSGFPIKLLNYLGMGLPTVAARGSAEPIPGVVEVPNSDAQAMARALGRLIDDGEERARLSGQAREAVVRDWTWDARAREIECIYGELLDRPPGGCSGHS